MRMGRLPLPKGSAKSVVFTLRLTEDERHELAAVAKRARKPASQWARDVLLNAAH
jgi:hypothetical protein